VLAARRGGLLRKVVAELDGAARAVAALQLAAAEAVAGGVGPLLAGAHDDLGALGEGDGAKQLDALGLVDGADDEVGQPALAARAGVAAGQLCAEEGRVGAMELMSGAMKSIGVDLRLLGPEERKVVPEPSDVASQTTYPCSVVCVA